MRLRRLLVYAGTSGLDLERLVSAAAQAAGAAQAKYEDYVEETFRAPVFHVAEMLLADYQAAAAKMGKAFNAMLEDIGSEETAVISMHLVYYRRLNAVVNPAAPLLAGLARDGVSVAVVDVVDDYYHVLWRIADRAARGVTPGVAGFQPLDPAGLLSWRGVHTSLAQMLAMEPNMSIYVYALKHSDEGHRRLAAMLLGMKAENDREYETAYISHPISKVRERAEREGKPLWDHPDAREIEEFKQRLERECPHLIVFSPTTVDELIPGPGGLATRIERENRWPHPENGLNEYPYPVDLSDELFDKTIYPVDKTVGNPGYLFFLRSLVSASIERRDLSYVAQADMVIAYRPTMYGEHHMGVETELKTATATAKPVYSVVPPEDQAPYALFRFEYPLRSVEELLRALRC